MSEMVERVARAVCAQSAGGFCSNIGGDLGCKNGRGVAPHGDNCVATMGQHELCGNAQAARAAIEAMREPTEDMVGAATEDWVPVTTCEGRGENYKDTEALLRTNAGAKVWRWMVCAALGEQPR